MPLRDELGARELEVLRLAAEGQTNKQIGRELHVSAETVKTHLAHIFQTLDAVDRTHAAVIAIRHGLIS